MTMVPNSNNLFTLNTDQLTAVSTYSTARNTAAIKASIVHYGEVAHNDAMRQLAVLGAIKSKMSKVNKNLVALNLTTRQLLESSERTNARLDEVIETLSKVDLTLKTPSETKARELAQNGYRALKAGWLEDAIKDLLESVDQHRYDPMVHLALAKAYLDLGRENDSASEYALAVKYSLSANPSWEELRVACESILALINLSSDADKKSVDELVRNVVEVLRNNFERFSETFPRSQLSDDVTPQSIQTCDFEALSLDSPILGFVTYWAVKSGDVPLISELLMIDPLFWVELKEVCDVETLAEACRVAVMQHYSLLFENISAFIGKVEEDLERRTSWEFKILSGQNKPSRQKLDWGSIENERTRLIDKNLLELEPCFEILEEMSKSPNSIGDFVRYIDLMNNLLVKLAHVIRNLETFSKTQHFGRYRSGIFKTEPLVGSVNLASHSIPNLKFLPRQANGRSESAGYRSRALSAQGF